MGNPLVRIIEIEGKITYKYKYILYIFSKNIY